MFEKGYKPNPEDENYFLKSLACPAQWIRFALPNENWAPWRVRVILNRV
jgi:hypothetical protein